MIGELVALLGAILVLLSAIGVNRFRATLDRLHALAKASTLGLLLILIGAAVNLWNVNDITSVVLAGVLHLLASPAGSNMISRAAYLSQGLPDGAIDEHAHPISDGVVATDGFLGSSDR
jgi:multicomponent Na+:H+ antiporter subunit G